MGRKSNLTAEYLMMRCGAKVRMQCNGSESYA